MKNPTEQFEELCEIEDINERITVACTKFTNLEISAKTMRMLFDSLNNAEKMQLLNQVYDRDVRKSNMERLPPNVLMPKDLVIEDETDISIWGTILKYELIREYEASKTEQPFYRFRNVINKYFKNPLVNVVATYIPEVKAVIEKETNNIAIQGFIDELMDREKKQDITPLGLPTTMTIGAELEFVGLNEQELKRMMPLLRQYGITYLDDFKIKRDSSVKEKSKNPDNAKRGTEVVSPVLDDTEESWERLNNACLFIQAIGGKVNKTCGGHVHIGENVLGVDKEAWKTFLNVWREVEPLIYMMSNRKGEKTRAGADRYAKMATGGIERIDWTCVKLRSEEDVVRLARELHDDEYGFDYYDEYDRYKSLNLTNLITGKQNTIEFRLSNGTVDYDILRENILLYGRMLQMAKMHSLDPNRKKKELEAFFEHILPGKEKVTRFLNLVFDDEEEKRIFYKRWESNVREYPIFASMDRIQTNERQTSRNVTAARSSTRR